MKKTTTEIIAREGWIELGVLYALFMGTLSLELPLLSFGLFALAVLRTYYYRNPERIPLDRDEFALLSPVDGEVVYINSTIEIVEIVIKNSFFDSHIVRSPIEGEFTQGSTLHGLTFRDFDRAERLNSKRGFSVGSISVDLFLNNDCHANSVYFSGTQRVFRGERVGFLKNGYCKIRLPSSRVSIALGDKVHAGKSSIAFLN